MIELYVSAVGTLEKSRSGCTSSCAAWRRAPSSENEAILSDYRKKSSVSTRGYSGFELQKTRDKVRAPWTRLQKSRIARLRLKEARRSPHSGPHPFLFWKPRKPRRLKAAARSAKSASMTP